MKFKVGDKVRLRGTTITAVVVSIAKGIITLNLRWRARMSSPNNWDKI